MRILVCVKRVPAPGARINITPDGQAIDTAYLGFTMSPHEECAVEEAVQLVERHGGEATVLTLGPAEADEQLRYAASLGVANAVLLPIDGPDWDPQRTASAIAAAIGGLESSDGPVDLILFGNESADSGGYQVGIRVARALGLPVVTGLKRIELRDGGVRGERDVGGARDVYEAALPALLTVLEGLNLPRYPSVPGKLRAKQKPLDRKAVSPPAAQLEKIRLIVPEGQGRQAEILGEGADAAPRVVELMQELGVA